jgi:hypothetical protein
MYTSKESGAPYKPSTQYGAWATFQKGYINFSANTNTHISIFGATQSGTSWPSGAVPNSIFIASGKLENAVGNQSAYDGPSQIVINESKVSITGIPRAPLFDMSDYRDVNPSYNPETGQNNGAYRGAEPLGYMPRQRMVIEDPVTGEAQLGLGVYYLDLTKVNVTLTSGPSDTMGLQGDLAVMF